MEKGTVGVQALNGGYIFDNCGSLNINFSTKSSKLFVRFNNEKSRDYTNPNLSSGSGLLGAGEATFLMRDSRINPRLINPTSFFTV